MATDLNISTSERNLHSITLLFSKFWAPFSSKIFVYYINSRGSVFRTFSELIASVCVMFTVHKNISWRCQNWKQRVWKGKNPGKYLIEGIPGNVIYSLVIGREAKARFKIILTSVIWGTVTYVRSTLANQKRRISAGFLEIGGFHRKQQLRANFFWSLFIIVVCV